MRLRSGGNGFLAASMDFLSRSDAEYLRLAIAAVPPAPGRVTQAGLVGVENQIRVPQSMSGAFWGAVPHSGRIRSANLRGAFKVGGRGELIQITY